MRALRIPAFATGASQVGEGRSMIHHPLHIASLQEPVDEDQPELLARELPCQLLKLIDVVRALRERVQ